MKRPPATPAAVGARAPPWGGGCLLFVVGVIPAAEGYSRGYIYVYYL
jgi:hypothetical protein